LIGGCFFGIPSLIAIILGVMAISQINASAGRETGKGMAIAGIILGGLAVFAFLAWLALVIIAALMGETLG
jgi:hypothetical protein